VELGKTCWICLDECVKTFERVLTEVSVFLWRHLEMVVSFVCKPPTVGRRGAQRSFCPWVPRGVVVVWSVNKGGITRERIYRYCDHLQFTPETRPHCR
jgi:hypothetical protein